MTTNDDPLPPPPPPPPRDVPPPPPPGQAGAVRRLRRLPEGKVLAGVAVGLGAYLGVDPVVVRIAFLALSFLGGTGVVLYLLAWATLPAEDTDESFLEAVLRRVAAAPPWAQVLLALGVLAVLVNALAEGSGILAGLILILIGVLLLRRTGADAPLVPAAAGTTVPQGVTPTSTWPMPPAEPRAWPPPIPAPPRPPRSILGRATLGCALLVVGVVAALDLLGAVEVGAERYLALVLTVIGAGLVVGARWGRARGLILLALVILPLLASANVLGVTATGGIGERVERPASSAELADEYRLAAGSTRLDLSGVDFGRGTTDVAASVGLGELVVVVPPDTTVAVDAAVRFGEVDLFGRFSDGADIRRTVTDEGRGGGGRLNLDLDGGVAVVTVRRGAERS